jgi:hypothetical protein
MTPSREVKAAATLAEQERIIKLLEEERKRHKEEGLLTAAVYLKDLIALIKGENK